MNTIKAGWYASAGVSALIALFIAAAILDHAKTVTPIDVGALFVTGALAGLFLGLGLASGASESVTGHPG